MSEFKNRIITISGEPASGKNTVIKKLKEYYEKEGYKVRIFNIGDMLREMALERGMSIEQFNQFLEANPNINIDKQIDSMVAKKGKQINSKAREKEVIIFNSRLAFHNIPDSFSIRLTVDDNVAGKRVFGDKERGKEDQYTTLEEAIQATRSRKESENNRYKEIYNVDLQNPDNYNLVIDTSYSTIEDIAEVIEQCLEIELEGKSYSKMWISPKKLLPLQNEIDTLGFSPESCLTLEQWIEKLKIEGYNPELPIKAIKVGNKYFNFNGNHRSIASYMLGNTLVPYVIIAENEELIPGRNITAKGEASSLTKHMLWGHEQFFDKPDKQFSYNHIYPGIYDELSKKEPEER